METFKIKSTFINSKYLHFLYPLMLLGLSIFIMSTPYLGFSEYAPFIFIATIAWTIYDIYKIKSYKKFFVDLNDQEINFNDKHTLQYKDIDAVAYYSVGFGMQPIITFNNNSELKIPAVIENLELLKNKLEKNLPEGCDIVNK